MTQGSAQHRTHHRRRRPELGRWACWPVGPRAKPAAAKEGRDVGAGAVRRPRSFGRGTLREKRLYCGPADGGHHTPPRTTRRRDPRPRAAAPLTVLRCYPSLPTAKPEGSRRGSFKGAGPTPAIFTAQFLQNKLSEWNERSPLLLFQFHLVVRWAPSLSARCQPSVASGAKERVGWNERQDNSTK